MIAGGTDLGGLCADSDVAAVAAFPDLDFALFEHLRCLQIVQQCAVALFVVLFDLRDEAEALCQLREALFLGSLGKVLIHIRPFVVFACGGSGQIGLRVADAGQLLEPELCVLLLVLRCFQKQRRHLLVALFFRDGREESVLVPCLRFACKGCAQIRFGFRACIFAHDPVSFLIISYFSIPCLSEMILTYLIQFCK